MIRKRQPINTKNRYLRKTFNVEEDFKQKLSNLPIFNKTKSDLEKELEKQRKDAKAAFKKSKDATEFRFSQGREGVFSESRKNTSNFLVDQFENNLNQKLNEIAEKARKLYRLKSISSNSSPDIDKKIKDTEKSLRKSQEDLINANKRAYEKSRDLVFDENDTGEKSLKRVRKTKNSPKRFRNL